MKKYLIGFIIAMISIIPISNASALEEVTEPTWLPQYTVPDAPMDLEYCGVVRVGNKIYYIGGSSISSGKGIISYDIDTKTYSSVLATLPEVRDRFPGVYAYGTDIYIFGGNDDGVTACKYCYKFNTITNEITRIADFPHQYLAKAGVVGIDNNVYIFGTSYNHSTYQSSVYKYDILTDSYELLSSIPITFTSGVSTIVGTDVYIFGSNVTAQQLEAYKYDILTDTFTRITDLPYAIYNKCVSYGTDIYFFGGPTSTYNKKVLKYNTLTDTYEQLEDSPYKLGALSIVVDNNVYIVGCSRSTSWPYKYRGTEVLMLPVIEETVINITANNATDLSGVSNKVINIDFEEVYDSNYTYQYKTDYFDWIDVTSEVNEAVSHGYYYYQFFLYYNTTVQARVLNGDKVVSENSITISDLRDYEDIYNYRISFSSSEIDKLGTIDLYVNFNELNIPHKFRLEYYSNDYSLSKIPKFSKYKGYLVDINGFKLDYNFLDYFEISYEEYKLFEGDYTTYLDGVVKQIKSLPSDAYGYRLSFEFDNISNFTFNVFDDYAKVTTWDYTLDFLSDYTKVYFPKDFDVAIIRSKNFQNISTSLIIPNINLVNNDYKYLLYYYDFLNSTQASNFNMNKLDFDNFLVNITIDEENNIFPIIYKMSEKENLYFYIKNDSYVQFYNQDNMDSYILGLDEDKYEENNDLVINNNFNNFIESNSTKDNDGFFKVFVNSFDNFREVVLEIIDNVTYFFDNLNIDLKYFYMVIFGLVLFGFLIRFIL